MSRGRNPVLIFVHCVVHGQDKQVETVKTSSFQKTEVDHMNLKLQPTVSTSFSFLWKRKFTLDMVNEHRNCCALRPQVMIKPKIVLCRIPFEVFVHSLLH